MDYNATKGAVDTLDQLVHLPEENKSLANDCIL